MTIILIEKGLFSNSSFSQYKWTYHIILFKLHFLGVEHGFLSAYIEHKYYIPNSPTLYNMRPG